MQGKLRAIGNGIVFLQNATVGRSWKLTLEGIYSIIAIVRVWLSAVSDDGAVMIKRSDGSVMSGMLHGSWSSQDLKNMMGRLLDLRRAYKQLASKPEHAYASVIAVSQGSYLDPLFFISRTLLFGPTAAVHGFNRLSKFVELVGVKLACLLIS